MNIKIRKYKQAEDYEKFLQLIESEGEEWSDYLEENYKEPLKKSITYVAYVEDMLCGYSRSRNDFDLYIWVIDLLVHQEYRGNSIGKKLLDCIVVDFPNQDILVMSDVDEYYEKLGYGKEGSIFKVE